MFDPSQYELLDFGSGRKLERFGAYVLDRPAPAAEKMKLVRPELWPAANARFEADASHKSGPQRGRWTMTSEWPATWTVHHAAMKFELKLTEFGHIGLFPEQAACWDWIEQQVRSAVAAGSSESPQNISPDQGIKMLNLFAYTGGSTLAAAAAGAAVTHVDAAENIVAWARRNAELSELSQAPVRWIADDALKFVQREVRRGRHYDAIVLDPPSYGHGSGGETWKIDKHLSGLLSLCREITAGRPRFLLLTCHAPDYDPAKLRECLVAAGFAQRSANVESGAMWLTTRDGRRLHSGVFARIAW